MFRSLFAIFPEHYLASNGGHERRGCEDGFISEFQEIGSSRDKYELDLEKIAEEEKHDGYYAIATNLDDDVRTVIGINEKRYKIQSGY